jgi:hypothetical protein
VDRATLSRLAEVGVPALPPQLLGDLTQYCWDRCEVEADARFCAIARSLEPIRELFDESEESGGVEMDFTDVDHAFRSRLPGILEEPDPQAATLLARALREETWRLLLIT